MVLPNIYIILISVLFPLFILSLPAHISITTDITFFFSFYRQMLIGVLQLPCSLHYKADQALLQWRRQTNSNYSTAQDQNGKASHSKAWTPASARCFTPYFGSACMPEAHKTPQALSKVGSSRWKWDS
uniref:Putative secreted protein n=1 Tax=Ixodes ricinus TaxID=34613 RepID=A0A147BEE9_IXORI